MTGEEWDARFKVIYREVIQEMNDGHFRGDMRDAWREARRRTTELAGPDPKKFKLPGLSTVKGGLGMLKKVLGVWSWFNGKKTAIGAALALVAAAIQSVIPPGCTICLPDVLQVFGVDAAPVLAVLGQVLIVIGLIHKFLKYRGEARV